MTQLQIGTRKKSQKLTAERDALRLAFERVEGELLAAGTIGAKAEADRDALAAQVAALTADLQEAAGHLRHLVATVGMDSDVQSSAEDMAIACEDALQTIPAAAARYLALRNFYSAIWCANKETDLGLFADAVQSALEAARKALAE